MSRAVRNGVAWDERTGLKVKGRQLRVDGETGILTRYPDIIHEQRYVNAPSPDGVNYRPGSPPRHAINTSARIGPFFDPVKMVQWPMPQLSLVSPGSFVSGDE
jgi:hypothetical protein